VDETTETIDRSKTPEPEAYAYRALGKLCLSQDASADLSAAERDRDQLSPETLDLLDAVKRAGLPTGDRLREVVRENSR